ncbi:MAG: PhzF family phenazine biosynthesis protein [Peptostreptococcaceae bacterium]|jgi:trans-2,3-dihydro-3-hydroxyanthranilate isomerase|nr:PhzF family phenazine biosynthesis protein [Peptostreptococcaceae bacterium]
MGLVVYQVDAFTDEFGGGNKAGVVPDASRIEEDEMKKIAKELGFSETAFVLPSNNSKSHFNIKFYTPKQEVDICGHATIGAFHVLASKGYLECNVNAQCLKNKKILIEDTNAGIFPIEIEYDDGEILNIMMTQKTPNEVFFIEDNEIEEIASLFNISQMDIGLKGIKCKPTCVESSLRDLILPINSLESLENMEPDFKKIIKYCEKNSITGIHAFVLNDSSEYLATVRNFSPKIGRDEESATGISNGSLGYYLYKNDILKFDDGNTLEFNISQGIFMNRPSKIKVILEKVDNDLTVKVGGRSFISFEGIMRCKERECEIEYY